MDSRTKVYIAKTEQSIKTAISKIFTQVEAEQPILKNSREVYLKVNGVHCKKHCYTNPEVLKATIEHLYSIGAKRVYVIEDSTLGNATRLVFALNGYEKICKDTGAKSIYLDEEKAETIQLNGQISIDIPRTVYKIVENRDSLTYINLPKLKTHNATVVTLGIKNQYGYFSHKDRKKLHDDRLHVLLAELYRYVKPDITIIDGIDAVSGEMPITAFEDRLVKKLGILIGGRDTLAVDVVGARILGYGMEEVPHLRLAYEQGLGEGNLNNIDCVGESLENLDGKSDWGLIDQFPKDVKVVRGSKKICREGCEINTLIALQMLIYDYKGRGGFFILMGQGFDEDLKDQLMKEGYTRGLIAGYCAVDEVSEQFRDAFGKKNIYISNDCCNVAETVYSMTKLAGLTTFDLLPTSTFKTLRYIISAKLHGSRAITAGLF